MAGYTGSAVVLDLAAGTVAGAAGIVVGHPLDLVKVRLQAEAAQFRKFRGLSMSCCLRATLQQEGHAGLWRGLGPPVFTAGLFQAVCFTSHEIAFNKLRAAGVPEDDCRIAAGLFSGGATVLVTMPTDSVKIQLQLESGRSSGVITDMVSCGRRTITTHGVMTLYQGGCSCLVRDVPSVAVYLVSYAHLKRSMLECLGVQANDVNGYRALAAECVAGGLAGSLSWAVAAPMDVVKTVQQEAAAAGRPLGLRAAMRSLYQAGGLGAFFRGFGPLVARGFPVNAVTFAVYERTKRWLGAPSSL